MEPFISVDDFEAMLGQDLADPNALEVKIALDSACQRVRTYLGQDVNRVDDDVEVHSGSGRRKLRLRQRPVREVTLVTIDGTATTNYTRRNAVITLKDADVWWFGNDNIEVTYTHGWDHDPGDPGPGGAISVPSDIRLVALILSRRVYESVGVTATAGALISETIGDYSYQLSDAAISAVTSATELLEAEAYALDRYRVDLIGDTPTY